MKALALIIGGLALAYAGCSARKPAEKRGPPFVKMQAKFEYSEHEPYAQSGSNRIRGQAYLTQTGGGVVSCSGSRVLLMPATSYFREMFWHMVVARSEPDPPQNPHPGLKNMIRRTECDQKGNFSFSEIPDGTWFLLTEVNARNGGVMIAEMTLTNSQTTDALLTEKHVVGR